MKKVANSILSIIAISLSFQAIAQEDSSATQQKDTTEYVTKTAEPTPSEPKRSIKEKIYVGGNLGVSFGDITSIAIEPMIGWKWNPKLSSGIGLSYWYYKYKNTNQEGSSYGYRLFSRYRVIPQIFLHAEWAQYFYDNRYNYLDFSSDGAGSVPYFFIGGGLSQPMGSNAHFFIQVLYDVIQSDYSIYRGSNDVYVSIGFAAGF